jgi:hypothetical protein
MDGLTWMEERFREEMTNNPKAADITMNGENVLTLSDFLEFVLRHKYRLMLPLVAGPVIAFVFALTVPKQWEGKTVLQVGQVYTASDQQQTTPIESPVRTIERVRLTQFQDTILRRLGLPTDPAVNEEADLIRSSAAARLIRSADLVEISVRGFSPADAKRYVEAYQAELIAVHQKLAQPSFDRIAAEIAQTGANLSAAQERRQRLQKLAEEQLKNGVAGKFSESVLLSDLVSKNDDELRRLERQKMTLQEQASPQRTFNTRPIGDLDISKRPVWPKKSTFVIVGGAAGLLLGLAWAFWRERRRRQVAG